MRHGRGDTGAFAHFVSLSRTQTDTSAKATEMIRKRLAKTRPNMHQPRRAEQSARVEWTTKSLTLNARGPQRPKTDKATRTRPQPDKRRHRCEPDTSYAHCRHSGARRAVEVLPAEGPDLTTLSAFNRNPWPAHEQHASAANEGYGRASRRTRAMSK